jgi:hypothetical protein
MMQVDSEEEEVEEEELKEELTIHSDSDKLER